MAPSQSRRAVPPRSAAPTRHPDCTVREAAASRRCAPSTIYRMINAGEIAAYKVGSRTIVDGESLHDQKKRNRIVPRGACNAE